MGGQLDEALQAAYAAAKRVRSETGLAEQPISIAAVVVAARPPAPWRSVPGAGTADRPAARWASW